MAKYYCILLDADNTLLDFDSAEEKALDKTLRDYGIEPDEEVISKYREINEGLWRQLERGQLRRDKLNTERFTRFLRAVDAAGNGAEMGRSYLRNLSMNPDVIPGTTEALSELAEVATLAVVSNGFEEVQTPRMRDSGLADFIEASFISEKYDAEKPSKKLFDIALRELGVEHREHVLVVGDGLNSDIRGAVNAGLDSCWFNPSGAERAPGDPKPTYEVRSLKELYSIVMEPEELALVGSKGRRHQV